MYILICPKWHWKAIYKELVNYELLSIFVSVIIIKSRESLTTSLNSSNLLRKCLDFDQIQAILGPSGITLGHILQAAFEDMGVYFFDFDLIKTILGTPGTTLRHLTEYFWTFWQMHALGGGGGGG